MKAQRYFGEREAEFLKLKTRGFDFIQSIKLIDLREAYLAGKKGG
jgi:hypothetical protein